MSIIERVSTGYVARPQFKPFHARTQRYAIGVAHRRAGKTVAAINDLVDGALRCPLERPRYAYLAPLRQQAKDVAWDYLKRYAGAIPGAEPFEYELRVDLPNGGRIRLYGADNPDALRGLYFDGVVLDEYAQMRSLLWDEVLPPTLSDRKGWVVFIGTPQGRDDFCKLYEKAKLDPEWFTFMLKASETGLIAPDELAERRRLMPEDQYNQEFECSFDAAVKGAYYAKLMAQAEADGRITTVRHEPLKQVETWWDLGIRDATAIWFAQRVGTEIRLIDYYEMTGVGLPHFVAKLRELSGERGYVYSRHIAPHDIKVRELTADGKSRLEVAAGLGIHFELAPDLSVEDGINAVRVTLPKCVFDQQRCAIGIEALRQYRADYDDKLDVLRPKPLHDKHSHAADAFRYGCITDAPPDSWSQKLNYRNGGIV